ncbi:MAG: hypothetical protein HPY83_02200 [Anaerolineae bacterium]|nr:hypothetical protein [Anaerolineae bacterium]
MAQMIRRISLLWPPGREPTGRPSPRDAEWAEDLDVDSLAQALAADRRQVRHVRAILVALCHDLEVIRYRQEVFADFSEDAALRRVLRDIVPLLQELDDVRLRGASTSGNELLQVLQRLRELELYHQAVVQLSDGLAPRPLRSTALRSLRQELERIRQSEQFGQLEAELPGLREALQQVASITIGVNLDAEGRPVGAALLAVNPRPFTSPKGLLARLLGDGADSAGECLAPLHKVADHSPSPFLQPLFRDLAEVLRQVSRPVARALDRYLRVQTALLADLASEVQFYLGAHALAERLRSQGLPVCRPVIATLEQRASHVEGLYNVSLALRLQERPPEPGRPEQPVPSDLDLGPRGRSAVLTGPNLGGKTTFIQAIGQAHLLAQAGLFAPGTFAELSPADGIYTHFPRTERPDREAGRLGEEAQRLAALFAGATPYSLVLLNESLSSTGPSEALYLAQDLLRALRLLGARVVYATHLHSLAAQLDQINDTAPHEPPTVSLVAGLLPPEERTSADDMGRTYKVAPGPPLGRSYAAEVARRYGIGLEQLTRCLKERGIALEGDEPESKTIASSSTEH